MEFARKKGICRGCILVLFSSIFFCNGQVTLSSNEAVCPNQQPILFLCNATGPPQDLVWSLNGRVVHTFPFQSTDLSEYSTGTSSVWFRNITNAQIQQQSALIINTLPSGSSFTVVCTYGGIRVTRQTIIINQPQPVENVTEFKTGCLFNVSWTHPSPRYIQYYRVRVNGKLYSEVRSTFVLIEVDQCRLVDIIAVDRCGQPSNATEVIIDPPTTTEPSVATTTEILPDMSIRNNVTDTRIIVIIVLILLLVLIIGIVVLIILVAIILAINTNKNKLPKGKSRSGKSVKTEGDIELNNVKGDDSPEAVNTDSGVTVDRSQNSQDNKGDTSQNSQDNKGDTSQSSQDNKGDTSQSSQDNRDMNTDSGVTVDRSQNSQDNKGDTSQSSQDNRDMYEQPTVPEGNVTGKPLLGGNAT